MKIIDLHCDSLYKFIEISDKYNFSKNNGHLSEESLVKGGYLAQCFAIYTPIGFRGENAYMFFKKQYNKFLKIIDESRRLSVAKNSFEIIQNDRIGKISAVLTIENAEMLNEKIERLKEVEEQGVKILGLVHNFENCLCYPHNMQGDLKPFGKEVVEALNYTDMIIDVSHLNYDGFLSVAKVTKKPFIASHSACRNLQEHTRNLTDEQIKIIANFGGVVGIPFYSVFLNGGKKTEITDIIYHLKHLIKIGGEDIAAIGTDFDGMECQLFFENASKMQLFTSEIIKTFGFNIAEKICYKNALRIL